MKAKGPKGRANRGYKHGLYTGYEEYRYGSSRPKPTLPRIFTGKRRELATESVLTHLRDWRQTPFENEGAARAGVRQTLCLEGYGWDRSDAEAAKLVAEGLHRLGAERPDWEQGQPHYSIPRENCARCGADIDLEDQTNGFRYCSDICARSYRQHLEDQVPWDHELRRQGYWQIIMSGMPVKNCPTCEKKFKPKNGNVDQVFCSPECLAILQRTIEDRPCQWCNEMFHPKDNTKRFCSMECAAANRVHTWRTENPPMKCEQCSTIFRPSTAMGNARFCSKRCFMDSKNARRRMPDRAREASCDFCQSSFIRYRADKRYCSSACSVLASDVRLGKRKTATPLIFDYMMKLAA